MHAMVSTSPMVVPPPARRAATRSRLAPAHARGQVSPSLMGHHDTSHGAPRWSMHRRHSSFMRSPVVRVMHVGLRVFTSLCAEKSTLLLRHDPARLVRALRLNGAFASLHAAAVVSKVGGRGDESSWREVAHALARRTLPRPRPSPWTSVWAETSIRLPHKATPMLLCLQVYLADGSCHKSQKWVMRHLLLIYDRAFKTEDLCLQRVDVTRIVCPLGEQNLSC